MNVVDKLRSESISQVTWLDAASAREALRKEIAAESYDADDWLERIAFAAPPEEWECVALGPSVTLTRGHIRKGEQHATFFWHNKPKDTLHLAMNAVTTPQLWVPVEPSAQGMADAFAALAPKGDEREFDCFFGAVETVRDFMDVENALTVSPFCESFPIVVGTVARSSEPDAMSHESIFESRFSKSRLTLLAVHGAIQDASAVLLRVKYAPARFSDTAAEWNRSQETHWPADMPVDVIAAFESAKIWTLESIERGLRDEPQFEFIPVGTLLSQRLPGGVEAFLRRYQAHPELAIRFGVAEMSHAFDLPAILQEMLKVETDRKLKSTLKTVLQQRAD